MTHLTSLSALIAQWMMSEASSDVGELDEFYSFMERNYWSFFEPTARSQEAFRDRLQKWVQGADESSRLALFRSLQSIQYFSREEIEALCVAAFYEHVIPWVMTAGGLAGDDEGVTSKLKRAVGTTWFCSVTDSMPIAMFCHLNGLSGRDYRPDWRSLSKLGDPSRIDSYIKGQHIERLVLLEDFVGSGSQFGDALRFARSVSAALEILAVPLIVCPNGRKHLERIALNDQRMVISPVIALGAPDFIGKVADVSESTSYRTIRQLAVDMAGRTKGDGRKWYGELGYDDTGGLVVLHSNAPDNTLPLFQRQTDVWHPPFPRASRI